MQSSYREKSWTCSGCSENEFYGYIRVYSLQPKLSSLFIATLQYSLIMGRPNGVQTSSCRIRENVFKLCGARDFLTDWLDNLHKIGKAYKFLFC